MVRMLRESVSFAPSGLGHFASLPTAGAVGYSSSAASRLATSNDAIGCHAAIKKSPQETPIRLAFGSLRASSKATSCPDASTVRQRGLTLIELIVAISLL